jgi:IS30 family transposase
MPTAAKPDTYLSTVTQTELDGIAEQLNTRPRKTLGLQTPAHALGQVLQ